MSERFKKSKRQKTKMRIALTGPAGSGKTLGALYLAKGLAGDWEKVCVIDTEQGRSLFYSNRGDLETGEFYQANLEPPFTVDKAIDYLNEAAEIVGENGCVILDSMSAFWSDQGGILELKTQIENQRGMNSFSAWGAAGKEQNRFVNTIMELSCHVIVTMRSKVQYAVEIDAETGKSHVKKLGLAAQQRDDTEYLFSTVFTLDREGNMAQISKDNTFLQSEDFYGRLTPAIGERLRAWAEDGVEPVVYTCEHCGKKIKSYAFEDGTVMSPQEIVERSKETYDMQLCMDCCLEAMAKATEEESEGTVEVEE